MNKMMKFLPHALIVGVLAGLMQFLAMQKDCSVYFSAWVGFAAWACYFFAGGTIKDGVKVTTCWIAGLVASIAILELGKFACGSQVGLSSQLGMPLVVAIIATLVILCEKIPALSLIPAWFVGSACFFALHTGDYKKSITVYIVSLLVAQVFGFATVSLRVLYTKMSGVK